MSLYLKLFDTTAQYEAVESSLILPNVSVCKDAPTTVHYNPWVDPYGGHEYVDLGLPSGTKWAKMNVGAASETDYGNYYMYGKGADDYSVTSGQSYYTGTENPLATSADTAAQVWRGQWHMPTQEQFEELIANTTYEWTAINGINGCKFTSKTDITKYVFFPAGGRWDIRNKVNVGSHGFYWSSKPLTSSYANYFLCYNKSNLITNDSRDYGHLVRPVAS